MNFETIAPHWDQKFKEILSGPDNPEYEDIPQLGSYEQCVIGECIKNTDPEILVDGRFGYKWPICDTCFKYSNNTIIRNIQKNRDVKNSIEYFYDVVAPRIVEHFEKDHVK